MSKVDLKHLVKNGTLAPNPKWTKKQILAWSRKMYYEVEVLRGYIIEHGLHNEPL